MRLHQKSNNSGESKQKSGGGFAVATPGTMRSSTYKAFADLIYSKSGIKLGPNKEALMHARIRKRMTKLKFTDFDEYLEHVIRDDNGLEIVELLDAISTNVTHFFRENRHFILLEEILRRWSAEGRTRLRIWSSAASTGEEPYSIAITVRESITGTSDAKILATDISTNVLRKAREGLYETRHIEKIPKTLLHKYFQRESDNYRVCDEVRRMLTFGRINLSTPPYPLKGPLDVIFCRNVMIYFDNEVRRRLLDAMYHLLRPGGYLMVGHAESLSGMLSNFRSVEPSVYIK